MKKIFTSLLALLVLLAMSGNSHAQCLRRVNVVTNGDFVAGNTGFGTGVPFDPTLCSSNGYIVADNFMDKCFLWANVGDHTSGAGLFMMMDGPETGGAVDIWSQSIPVCPNTTYTFSYWGYNLYAASPFPVNFVVNGTPTAAANLTFGAWTQRIMVWNSGVAPPPVITIALRIPSGDIHRDFGIDDIAFEYCDNLDVSPPTTICPGGCATLTATGAPQYLWSTGATTPAITVCPATTTTYTVWGTDGCLLFGPVQTTVIVMGTSILTPSVTICPGSCATLTASGAATYVWNPGGMTGSSVSVCPGVNTTYTVTGTAASGCTTTATATVSIATSPTVTTTASPGTLTPPSATTSLLSSTVSGGSGFTYSWSPAATLSNATVSNPVATPTTTTVYTLTVTNSAGCTATSTVQVTVTPQSLCALNYDLVIPGGTAASALPPLSIGIDIHIYGVFTVDVPFSFGGCNVVMEPNSRIEVLSGVGLQITQWAHFYTCDSMWDGINLQNGASLHITNYAIIEDARAAVTINQGATAIIEHCIFNKNYTAVKLTSNTSGVSPLQMKDCVVTSRDFNFNVNPYLNPTTLTAWTNIVAGVYPSINMKWPFYSYRSIYGVEATDVNTLNVGTAVSSAAFNGFDNVMAAGIHLTRTNAIIYNNRFRSITSTMNCLTCTPLPGVGVYGVGSNTAAYSVKVGGMNPNQANDFYNVNTSVDVSQYTTNNVLKNTIFNTSSTTALYGGYGKIGIRATPAANNSVKVVENVITNCATGIHVNRNNTTATQTVTLMITSNQVSANASGFCNTAISVTDPSAAVVINSVVSEIINNTVIEAGTCINLLNVTAKNNVYYNSCMTRYAASGSLNGIKLVNCQNQTIQQNHTKYDTGVAGTNLLAYGIYLQNSPTNLILCNTIEDATRGLVFSGNCAAPHSIQQNTMRRAQVGWVLLTSTTVVGPQGIMGLPINNYWDMTFPMTTQILSLSATPLVMYVTPGGPATAVTQPTTSIGFVTINLTGATPPAACGPVPARLAGPGETQEEAVEETVSSIAVFPNPNNGQFTISATTSAPKDVMVYDMTGRLVFSLSQTTETLIPVDISGEAKGLYVVNVICAGEIQSARISNQ
ncbi:MAG TPA: T9SS type A sorting domain-containing protein [Bacteroidia bacterium]|nr:T9SS type A sorting domain-containing protein [Bacteroidia bacterium]